MILIIMISMDWVSDQEAYTSSVQMQTVTYFNRAGVEQTHSTKMESAAYSHVLTAETVHTLQQEVKTATSTCKMPQTE